MVRVLLIAVLDANPTLVVAEFLNQLLLVHHLPLLRFLLMAAVATRLVQPVELPA